MVQFGLTTLVMAGPGGGFFAKGVPALLRFEPDMNALVVLGTSSAWGFSVVALFAPWVLPAGAGVVYFEATAVIVTLILLGRWLEARARGQTGAAFRKLVALRPKTALVERGKEVVEIAVDEIRRGDVIQLRPGERIAVDGVASGVLGLADPVKPGAAAAVAALRGTGLRVVLITGHPGGVATAISLSRAVMRNVRQNLGTAFGYNIVLVKPLRAGNGYRVYRASDAQQLGFLRSAPALGFSIEQCRALVALWEDEGRTSADVQAIAQVHLVEIEAKIADLSAMRDTLAGLMRDCAADGGRIARYYRGLLKPPEMGGR